MADEGAYQNAGIDNLVKYDPEAALQLSDAYGLCHGIFPQPLGGGSERGKLDGVNYACRLEDTTELVDQLSCLHRDLAGA